MSPYWQGVLTVPAAVVGLVLLVVGSRLAYEMFHDWWTRPALTWIQDPHARICMAASVTVARRSWGFRIPTGWIIYANSVSRYKDDAQQWERAHDALLDVADDLRKDPTRITPKVGKKWRADR